MKKEELRKLRTLNATREMMEKAADNAIDKVAKNAYGWKERVYKKYAMFLRCQCLGKYLKIAVFLPKEMQKGIKSPKYEIFINLEGEEFITREWIGETEKWRTGKIDSLFYYWGDLAKSEKTSWMNQDGKNSIKRKLNVSCGGFEGILEYQKRINEEKIKERRRKETKPWDDDMALMPELPQGFLKWQKKEGIPEHYIFYEYKKGGAKHGYCSHCEQTVEIRNPRHGKQGVCRRCRARITYKATGKIGSLATDAYKSQIVQEMKGGIVVRTFRGWKHYRGMTPDKPYYCITEIRRTLFRGDKIDTYNYELYKNTEMRWVRDGFSDMLYEEAIVYGGNMRYLEKTVLKRSGLPNMIRDGRMINSSRYLLQENGNPAIEQLAKIGLTRMAKEMMESLYKPGLLNEDATQLAKMLKIDTNRLNRLKKMDAGLIHLEWMKKEKEMDTILSDELIDYFGKAGITPRELNFILNRMSYTKIYNYIVRQKAMGRDADTARQILQTWKDYLDMAEKAGMDTEKEMIYKPKNLKSAHNEAVLLLQEEDMEKMAAELAKKWPHVNEVCGTLEKYEMTGKEYSVVAPRNGIIDIVREGTSLHHCVHTCTFYFDRIEARESYLLFLRRTECIDVPYYTLEVEPSGNIRQKRTTGDNQNEDFQDAVKWLKKWQQEIRKRLTKEDEELGRKSNEARIRELKKLREDGNKIWHGKLEGKLLVEVLEEDFMEAM